MVYYFVRNSKNHIKISLKLVRFKLNLFLENILNLCYNSSIDKFERRNKMKISTKGRYALRMLIELAINQNESFVSLKDISEHQNISKKYLEQIVPMLNSNGILRTTRGNKGGYMLARMACEISAGDVLRATEGTLSPVLCLEYFPNNCPRAKFCSTLFIWEGLYKTVSNYLDRITLQDIVDHINSTDGSDYCI